MALVFLYLLNLYFNYEPLPVDLYIRAAALYYRYSTQALLYIVLLARLVLQNIKEISPLSGEIGEEG